MHPNKFECRGCRHGVDKKLWFACVFNLVLIIDGLLGDDPVVNTKWGYIRGKWSNTARNRSVANYLGIPYALPPVGNLRFENPQPWNRSWMTDYDGTYDREMCMQLGKTNFDVKGSEDCLYLNIFVPHVPNMPEEKSLSVFVVVHGGAFLEGSSYSKEWAPDYLLDQDLILVTLNYRLNAIGFFSTTNKVAAGNYGAKDVKVALQWVQENIAYFKGNPKSVTVMGHSAGSILVHLLVLSNKTEALFHRYILQSGSALSLWAYYPKTSYRKLCLELARRLDCLPAINAVVTVSNETIVKNYDETIKTDEENDEEMMKCLRKVEAREIVKMSHTFYVWRDNPKCIFGPTLEDESEDAVVTMPPLQAIKAGLFRDIPAIMLVTRDEGLITSIDLIIHREAGDEFVQHYEEYLQLYLGFDTIRVFNSSAFAQAIEDFYFNGSVRLNLKRNLTQLMGDVTMIYPMFRALRYQSRRMKNSIYFGMFAYQGTFSSTFSTGSFVHYGVNHGDELNYFFPKLNYKYRNLLLHNTETDVTMINIMTEMWANFVNNGVPSARMIPAWPDYRDHHEFMRIDRLPDIAVQTDFLPDRMEFWEKMMPNTSESMERELFPFNSPTNAANTVERRLTVHLLPLMIIFYFA